MLLECSTRLMTMMDAEVSACMEELFRKWGVTVVLGSTVEGVALAPPQPPLGFCVATR